MKKHPIIILVSLFILLLSCHQKQKKESIETAVYPDFEEILSHITENYKSLTDLPLDSMKIPRSLELNGEMRGVTSRDWCSGFYPGIWWMLYDHTRDSTFAKEAEEWTWFIEKEKNNSKTHDMGFKIYCSFGLGHRITTREDFKEIIIHSAKTLSKRYNAKVGAIRSWDTPEGHKWPYPVIIDNMMNLELLFAATRLSGDSSFYEIAVSHADVTFKDHFREDYSSYHVVNYDTINGQPNRKETHQGFSDESSWARGQGWGLYGYTLMYRETKKQKYLDRANKIAQYIISNLPEDYIPFWDFNDPKIPDAPIDASAGAIYASALLELQQYVSDETKHEYRVTAENIIKELSSDKYLREATPEAPFLLNHSTGNLPHNDEIDVPIIYADYYFIEALLRANHLCKSIN